MKRGFIAAILACAFALPALSQEQESFIDSEKIKLAVLNTASDYHYPKLFERYAQGDTTLTLEEYRHLYYGYIYEDSYRPLETNTYSDSLLMVLHLNSGEVIEPHNFAKVVYYASKVLETRPFDLNFINMLTYCYQKQNNIEEAAKYSYKLTMIIETILSSGTGVDKKSPWHILYREDANDILGLLRARYYKRMYITTTVEYFLLTEKVAGVRGYYFDISRIYLKIPERENSSNEKRKMEFNPKYNPKSNKFLSPEIQY